MAKKKQSRRGPRRIEIELPKRPHVGVYANATVADALEEVALDLTLYKGVKLAVVLEAIYEQGLRDGRREVFEELDRLKEKPELKHRNPGRPKKNSKKGDV